MLYVSRDQLVSRDGTKWLSYELSLGIASFGGSLDVLCENQEREQGLFHTQKMASKSALVLGPCGAMHGGAYEYPAL